VLWTATAVCFEASSRRLGSLSVNVLRLAVAAVLFSALSLLRTHHFLSVALSQEAWFYLGLFRTRRVCGGRRAPLQAPEPGEDRRRFYKS